MSNRVVINTLPLLSPITGIGTYILNLSKAFRSLDQGNEYTYFYGYFGRKLLTYEDSAFIRSFSNAKEGFIKNPLFSKYGRKFKDMLPALNRRNFDLYFEPNITPTNIKAKKVVTTVCDLSFKKFPHCQPKDRTEYFNQHFDEGLKRSNRVIVLSKKIKEELLGLTKIKDEMVDVIPAGVDRSIFKQYSGELADGVKEKYSLPEKFILYVGTIEPRKNLKGLLDAYLSRDIKSEFKLVIVGASGWGNKEELKLFADHMDDVVFLGHIPSIDIALLMNTASCLVYPSFYEGFGLPPLEAMACGCPVVVSNISSLPETCGDAVYYVDPYNVNSITDGIHKVVTDEAIRESLIKRGLERAKNFCWEKSAKEHLKVFNDILNPG